MFSVSKYSVHPIDKWAKVLDTEKVTVSHQASVGLKTEKKEPNRPIAPSEPLSWGNSGLSITPFEDFLVCSRTQVSGCSGKSSPGLDALWWAGLGRNHNSYRT